MVFHYTLWTSQGMDREKIYLKGLIEKNEKDTAQK